MQVRSQVGSITSDFANDVARARTEAITRNSCVAICTSINTANALTGGTPTCAAAGNKNWQNGWIIFANPTCSTTQNNPTTNGATLIAVRQAGDNNFTLEASNSLRRFAFEARGLMTPPSPSNFTLAYIPENVDSVHYRSICISSSGRVTTKQYAGVSACL
jgi:type IV fimbrial biogenesis protein FimT